jgi:hypothetical protein
MDRVRHKNDVAYSKASEDNSVQVHNSNKGLKGEIKFKAFLT